MKMKDMLRKEIEQVFLQSINRPSMLFNSSTIGTSSSQGSANNITLDDIVEIYAKMDAMPPFAAAIWFIDEPNAYMQFMLEYNQRYQNGIVHIYEWTLKDMDAHIETQKADERDGELFGAMLERGELFPFRRRGVFVEMNKGNHYWMVAGQLIELTSQLMSA